MKFTAEQEEDLTLPDDSMHRARLEEVKLKTFTWNDNGADKEGQSLEWWWEITATDLGPKFVGRKVKGECKPVITNREGNRFREWSEALLRRDIPVGMSIDTDDLVGLEATIVIGHRQDKKDPAKSWEFVSMVAPLDESEGSSLEPPF